MTITPKQLTQALEQLLRDNAEPVNANPPPTPDRASDFIPASLVYEHEKAHRQPQSINQLADTPPVPNTFTPVVEPAPVEQDSVPEFVLTPMEADLKEVLRHCLDVENQTLFTVENVLLQQLLRIFLRLEAKMDGLEELITDELLGTSKDDQPHPQSQLVFQNHGEEENNEKQKVHITIEGVNYNQDGEEIVQEALEGPNNNVPRSSGKSPKEKGNAGKRRRRKRNRKNKR